MPLYVTDGKLQLGEPGKLAAQRSCCCNEEGDDPGDCFCPDGCLYQVSMNGVFAVSVDGFGPCFCQYGSTTENFGEFPNQGAIITVARNCVFIDGSVSKSGGQLITFPEVTLPGGSSITPLPQRAMYVAAVSVRIYCDGTKNFAEITWVVSCRVGAAALYVERFAGKGTIVELPSVCDKKANASCIQPDQPLRANYLAAPIEITISEASPGIGAWNPDYSSSRQSAFFEGWPSEQLGNGEAFAAVLDDLFESLRTITGTFRITQRDSCQLTGCPCSKRGVGHTLYAVEETGTELCCPPGTTVLPGESLCECQPNDPQCTQGLDGGWYVSPQSSEGWQDCGDVCVPFDEDCPP